MSLASDSGSRRRRAWTGLAVGGLAGFIATDIGLPALVSWWQDWTYIVVAAAVVGAVVWWRVERRAPPVAAVVVIVVAVMKK